MRTGISLAFLACTLFVFTTTARAATITVDSTADENSASTPSGNCTLREAVLAANSNTAVDGCSAGESAPIVDRIEIPPGAYELTIEGDEEDGGETGDLDVTEALHFVGIPAEARGDGDRAEIDSGSALDRVLHVHGAVEVLFHDVDIAYGAAYARPGEVARGGTILNEGKLTLRESSIQACLFGSDGTESLAAGDAWGGAIYSTGPLLLEDVDIVFAEAFGGEGFPGAQGGHGGDAYGGAIAALADLTIRRSRLECELFGGDGGEGSVAAGDGGDAFGGCIHAESSVLIEDSFFELALAFAGEGGAPSVTTASGGDGGRASGGALHLAGAAGKVTGTLFSLSQVFGGDAPGGGRGGDGYAGGVVFSSPGASLEIEEVTFHESYAFAGYAEGSTVDGPPAGDGGDAVAGAILLQAGILDLRNVSFQRSEVYGGSGADAAEETDPGGHGGAAIGSHLVVEPVRRGAPTALTLAGTILAEREIFGGVGGAGTPSGMPGSAAGEACAGVVDGASLGGNVEALSDSCGLAPTGTVPDQIDVSIASLELEELADNGGPTMTLAIGATSVARDAAADCNPTDQRGALRIDGACDAGAFEFGAPPPIFSDGFESGATEGWAGVVGAGLPAAI